MKTILTGLSRTADSHPDARACAPRRIQALPILTTALFAMLHSGCATVTQGVHQSVAIETPSVAAAECRVVDRDGRVLATVVTPGSARLRSGKKTLDVVCERAGYAQAREPLKPSFNKRARLQGPPGMLVDAISGAMWRFPEMVRVVMHALDSGGRTQTPAAPTETETPTPR